MPGNVKTSFNSGASRARLSHIAARRYDLLHLKRAGFIQVIPRQAEYCLGYRWMQRDSFPRIETIYRQFRR